MENKNITCTVTIEGETRTSDDFVVIMNDETGMANICYHADALTLGMAMKMITREFVKCMHALPEEERGMVSEILGEDFDLQEVANE